MLGAGAMGTVYRARDRELDEIVALKMLKKELASAEMLERFRREVKLARRVTHKNVARTFDIGEHDGDRFLTMEFIEGEMLGALLARRGRLPIPDVVRFGLDVCAGLSAAHAAGVLHRDLKPENVIVARDGRAVITDFGIARAVSTGELSRTVGGLVGTPAYMAPEQVEGATDLDARADLYALGTMLYELLTGQTAWGGDSVVTIAAGRLLKPPPDIRSVLPNLDPRVAELVQKLMARRRDDRFASADETAEALGALVSVQAPRSNTSVIPKPPSSGTLPFAPSSIQARSAPGARSVAVLPVLNLGHLDDAYLVDNVNEDIVDLLSVVPGLLVRPRGETARYVDPSRDVRAIGRGLGVDVVVDGSLRCFGETVRASFRLIAVEDGFQLWARRFDRRPAEVLSIADDAAQAIARVLTTDLAPSRNARPADPEAEELYLRGRFLVRRGWQGSTRDAVDLLARAHERAPDDARILGAYALSLARVYGLEFHGFEVAERAREKARRALELDPKQAEAKVALATVHLQNGEADAAVGYLRDALALAPNSIDALDSLGRIMAEIGRVEEGIALLARAVAIDPEYTASRLRIARLRGLLGDIDGMNEALGQVPAEPGDRVLWFAFQARHALWHRDQQELYRLEGLLAKHELPTTARFQIASVIDAGLGRATGLFDTKMVNQALPIDASRPPRHAAFNAQMRCELFLGVGESAKALEALKAADAFGFSDVVFLDRCPLIAPLREVPAFVEVYERVKLRARRILAAIDARKEQPSR